jgi:myo-inositol 2-dehydrogenase / D-chiro-inositol 1-dehydrogenase
VTIGVGIVGCGRVAASWHLPALANVPEATVVALADRDVGRAHSLAAHAPGARVSADYRELLADSAVELVAVCVPVADHPEVAIAALEAGKHVLVEKPLALSLDGCERIVAAANAAPGKAAVGFNQRELPLARHARDVRRSGQLGEIQVLRTTAMSDSRLRGDDPPWRWSRSLGGGVLIEHAIHHFDLWRFLLDDEIEEVFCLHSGDDESATVTARAGRGALVVGTFSDVTPTANDLELCGVDGRLQVSCLRFDGVDRQARGEIPGAPAGRLRRTIRLPGQLGPALGDLRLGGSFAATFTRQWRRLITSVREDRPVECSLQDGVRAVGILLAVLESTNARRPVEVAQAARHPVELSGDTTTARLGAAP